MLAQIIGLLTSVSVTPSCVFDTCPHKRNHRKKSPAISTGHTLLHHQDANHSEGFTCLESFLLEIENVCARMLELFHANMAARLDADSNVRPALDHH